MTITEYEERFHALSKYSVINISIESERIHKFMKGLEGIYHLAIA